MVLFFFLSFEVEKPYQAAGMLLGLCVLAPLGLYFGWMGRLGGVRAAAWQSPCVLERGTGRLGGGILWLQQGHVQPGRESCVWVQECDGKNPFS